MENPGSAQAHAQQDSTSLALRLHASLRWQPAVGDGSSPGYRLEFDRSLTRTVFDRTFTATYRTLSFGGYFGRRKSNER